MSPSRAALLLLVIALFSPATSQAQIVQSCDFISFSPNPVTGRPYSAVLQAEVPRLVADGTHMISKERCRLYRDSAGKMRLETFLSIGGVAQNTPNEVSMIDPSAHVLYVLDQSRRIAQATSFPAWVSICEQRESMHLFVMPAPSIPTSPTIPDDVDDYIVKVRAPCSKTSEYLGTQTMEGVLVTGERTTWTLPLDAGGNRPKSMVDEVWTSTDLELTILSRHSDSDGGEIVMRTISLDRSEPDPALFQIPPDYTVEDSTSK